MRPAISRLARSGRLGGLAVTALLLAVLSACGGGGGGGGAATQPTQPATSPPPSAAASPQRPALASPATGASPAAPSASPAAGGGAEQTREIQSGDTLQSIAEEVYGDAGQWQRIYDANRDVIGNDPNALKIGTTLRIPPRQP